MDSKNSTRPTEDASQTGAHVEGKINLDQAANAPNDILPPQPPQPMNQAAESSPIPAKLRTEPVAPTDQALRTSELNYRRLFETAQDGILILDAETGRVNDVNPFLIKLLGFSHDEMVGKTVGELSPFKNVVSNQAMLEKLQKDRYVRYENLPLETRDARHITVKFISDNRWKRRAIAEQGGYRMTGAGFDRQKQYSLEDARQNRFNKKQFLARVSRAFC